MNIQAIKVFLIHVLMLGNWTAACTAAFVTILPMTVGKATIGEITTGFLVTFVLVVTGGYLSHIKDQALKSALTNELNAIVQDLPLIRGAWTATKAVSPSPQPLTLPTVPKSDTPTQ